MGSRRGVGGKKRKEEKRNIISNTSVEDYAQNNEDGRERERQTALIGVTVTEMTASFLL